MSRGPIPDDFEYPTPQRETLWTLPDKKRHQMARQSPPRDPNAIADIAGSSHGTTAPYIAMKRFVSKPDLFDSRTVEGASPKRLVPLEVGRNNHLIDKSLRTSDLPAAQPNVRPFRTQRVTDPLVPVYPVASKFMSVTTDPNLADLAAPSHGETLSGTNRRGLSSSSLSGVVTNLDGTMYYASGTLASSSSPNKRTTDGSVVERGRNPYSPSFPHLTGGAASATLNLRRGDVRDVLKIDDIKGTSAKDNKSNTVIRTQSPPRDNIDYSDVPLSTAGSRHHREVRNPYTPSMSLVTSDICKNDIVTLQSNRHTNPLEPRYAVTGPQGTVAIIGEVRGAKPKPQPALRSDRPMLSLRSEDIEGAQPLVRFGDSLTKVTQPSKK